MVVKRFGWEIWVSVPLFDQGSHRDMKWIYKIIHTISMRRINVKASRLAIPFPKASSLPSPLYTHPSCFQSYFHNNFKIRKFSSLMNNLMFVIYLGADVNKMFLILWILWALMHLHGRVVQAERNPNVYWISSQAGGRIKRCAKLHVQG